MTDPSLLGGPSFDEVIAVMRQRRSQDSILLTQGVEIRDRYNGDVVLPLTDVDGKPMMDPPGPRLVAAAVDGLAMRAASARPSIICPTSDQASKQASNDADIRRRMLYAKWNQSQLDLKMYRSYRHLSAYGTCAYVVMPDDDDKHARIDIRDPLTCVDSDTEILTKRGWLRHDALTTEDVVAGYDMETDTARWTHLDGINRFDYDGDLVTVERKGLSMRVTPDHRCVAQKRIARDVNRPGPVQIVLGDELNRTHYIPRSALWDENGEKSIGRDLAALVGWVAAEGHYNGPYRYVYLSQSKSENAESVAEIDGLIERLGNFPADLTGRQHARKSGLGVWRHERERRGKVEVEWRLPLGLGQEIQRLMPDKLLGEWCLDLPPDERQALLDAFIAGDGSNNGSGWMVFQKLRHNLDVLQMVAVTLGYRTNLSGAPDGSKWTLYLQDSRRPASLRGRAERDRRELPREHYTGTVWCPTTGTGTWFARRNGTVFITGNCYPELRSPDDIRNPKNVGFIFGRSVPWIKQHFPDSADFLANAAGRNWDTLWDVVEWIDDNVIIMGILGPRMPAYSPQDSRPYGYNGHELRRWKNKAGICTAVIPRRATLDRIQGQMSTLIGNVDMYTRMMALATIAAEKHTFPDVVLNSSGPNEIAELVSGSWSDGRTGKVNIVRNGRAEFLVSQPPPFVLEMIHELESGIRESGGASGLYGGDSPSPLRTGRALDTLGNFAIDPRVEEAQKIQSYALAAVNRAVIAVEKGYWPNKKYSMFTGLQGDGQTVEYVPSVNLDSDENSVHYPLPGADINQMSVALAQLSGAGLMSKHTAMVMHPVIPDADQETQRIEEERLADAVLGGLQQQAAGGQLPVSDAARILQLLRQGDRIEDAILTAQKEAQARQATHAPPPEDGQAAAPETQPGLAAPGMGAEQPAPPPPTLGGPNQSQQNLQALLGALKTPPPPQPLPAPANQ